MAGVNALKSTMVAPIHDPNAADGTIAVLVNRILARSKQRQWLHLQSALYYRYLHNWISFPMIIINSVSAVIGGSAGNEYMRWVTVGILLINSIVQTLTRHFKFSEKANRHQHLYTEYLKLANQIQTECATVHIPTSQGVEFKKYMDIYAHLTEHDIMGFPTKVTDAYDAIHSDGASSKSKSNDNALSLVQFAHSSECEDDAGASSPVRDVVDPAMVPDSGGSPSASV